METTNNGIRDHTKLSGIIENGCTLVHDAVPELCII